MPHNLQPAVPADVLLVSRFSNFQEELRFEGLVNGYPDGSSDRASLVLNPRRFWKLSTKVTPAQYTSLRNFFNSHPVQPFFFYVPRERVPQWSPPDSSGSDPTGRYTVVFDGSWSDGLNVGRSEVSFALREVA